MERRAFLAAAGVGTGAILAGSSLTAVAAEKVPEKRLQVYQCEECGAIVEVLEPGMPSLVHCGKPMKLLAETTSGEMAGKHLPVIEKIDGGYKVTVGARRTRCSRLITSRGSSYLLTAGCAVSSSKSTRNPRPCS